MKKIVFCILILICIIHTTFLVKAENNVSVSLYDSASIRMETPSGIRFKAKVTNPQDGYKYGMVFINHLVSNVEDLYVGSTDSVYAEVDCLAETNEYTVSLVNFPEYGYLDDITVRAYVQVDNDTYIYSDHVVSKTIKDIATKAYEDGNDNQYIKDIALFDKTILVRYDSLSKEVAYNTSSSELDLPTTITLYDKYDQAYHLGVTWNLSNYDGTKAGTTNIQGTLDLGTTYITKKFEISYQITVKNNPVIFDYDFRTMSTLDSAFENKSDGMYKDTEKGVALKSSGKYIITPSFNALGPFKVTAEIRGRSTSGNATITIYGLDSSGNVLEKQAFTQVISTSNSYLYATFTNTLITKIKFEYTTKATGNIGISTLKAEYTDDISTDVDELESISVKDYTTNYYVGSTFDYLGTIVKTYTSGKTEEVSLTNVKSDLEVVFDSTTPGNFVGSITYLGFTTTFNYSILTQEVTDTITSKVDNVMVYAIDLSASSNDTLSLIRINQGTNQVNIIIDQGPVLSDASKAQLTLQLESLINNKISYYYSLNNSSYFDNLSGKPMVINYEYYFTKEVLLTIKPNGFILDCLGYVYYDVQNMSNSQIELDTKVDILWANNTITESIIEALDPETIILPEGNLTTFIELAKAIYTYDDEIFQYSPTLNKNIWHVFTDISYYLDGESTKELSSYSEWSNAETNGLHHASMVNYLYREAYYGDISNLSGDALVTALRKVITNTHTFSVSYGENKTYLQQTDADPFNEGNIMLIYLGTSVTAAWDGGTTWNREHVWPKSLSGGLYTSVAESHRGAGSDLHHIKPANPSENTSRNNKAFGTVTNSTYYCPRDGVKGDVARILFYMSVRYDMDIEQLGVAQSTSMLLEWNDLDQVDSFERNRNRIVQSIQGNYNPFVDNPWLADLIW